MTSHEASTDGGASNDLEWRVYDALVSPSPVSTSCIAGRLLPLPLPPSRPPPPSST